MHHSSSLSLSRFLSLLTVLALALGLNYALAAWTGPTATPPDQNTPAPLNAGPLGQTKLGGLELGLAPGIANALLTLNGKVGFATTSPASNLEIDVKGNVGATAYCDENGNNCVNGGSLAPPPPANPDPLATFKERYGLQKWPSYIVCSTNYFSQGAASVLTLSSFTASGPYVGVYYYAPGAAPGIAQNGPNTYYSNLPFIYKINGSSANGGSVYSQSGMVQIQCPTPLPLNGNIWQP